MKITVVGTGNVGAVLGRRFAESGHEITFASRTPSSERVRDLIADLPNVTASPIHRSAAQADVVLYAGPYEHAHEILQSMGDMRQAVLIDCTNPLNESFDGLRLGHTESAGERIAAWVPTARVVKAFNTTSVATMSNPLYGDQIATQFYCGDDAEAKTIAAGLIAQLQMEPVDAGPLRNARYLEATAMLYIHLAIRGGWGGNCALKMLKR